VIHARTLQLPSGKWRIDLTLQEPGPRGRVAVRSTIATPCFYDVLDDFELVCQVMRWRWGRWQKEKDGSHDAGLRE